MRALENDIQKFRAQKSTLSKKMKVSTDKYEKFKQVRGRELIQAKKANLKKDREIQKLK